MSDVGLDVQWQVMLGREEFYNATKRLHNALQGNPGSLDDDEWAIFERFNEMNATEIEGGWDVIIGHDPQPIATRKHVPKKGKQWIWRCHIALSEPNPAAIEPLVPMIREYDGTVFPIEDSVPKTPDGAGSPHICPPAIDP